MIYCMRNEVVILWLLNESICHISSHSWMLPGPNYLFNYHIHTKAHSHFCAFLLIYHLEYWPHPVSVLFVWEYSVHWLDVCVFERRYVWKWVLQHWWTTHGYEDRHLCIYVIKFVSHKNQKQVFFSGSATASEEFLPPQQRGSRWFVITKCTE